jgi:hypothetical protein
VWLGCEWLYMLPFCSVVWWNISFCRVYILCRFPPFSFSFISSMMWDLFFIFVNNWWDDVINWYKLVPDLHKMHSRKISAKSYSHAFISTESIYMCSLGFFLIISKPWVIISFSTFLLPGKRYKQTKIDAVHCRSFLASLINYQWSSFAYS